MAEVAMRSEVVFLSGPAVAIIRETKRSRERIWQLALTSFRLSRASLPQHEQQSLLNTRYLQISELPTIRSESRIGFIRLHRWLAFAPPTAGNK
jgi:hypothetical protein